MDTTVNQTPTPPVLNEPAHSERAHAPLGGSSALQWGNCSGFAFYAQNSPPFEDTPATLKGTAGHEIAEKLLTAALENRISGTSATIHVQGYDRELVDWGTTYVNYVWERVLNQTITDKYYAVEDRVALDEALGMYGFIDLWIIYTTERALRRGVVVDYKTGRHDVDAEKNAQLAFYATALRAEIRRGGKDLDEVQGVIIQPSLSAPRDYKETLFTSKQLDIWEKRFFKQANQIFVAKKPQFKVGSWCELCRFRGPCEAYNKALSTKTGLSIVDVERTALPAPQSVPDDILLKWITHAPQIEAYLKSMKDYAKIRFLSGNAIAGTKCVQGRSNRKWVDESPTTIGQYLHDNGVEKPLTEELIGIPAVERELVRAHGKERASEILAAVVTKPPGALTLVLDEDERLAVQSGVDLLRALPSS